MDALIMFFYMPLWLAIFLFSKRNLLYYVCTVFLKRNVYDNKDGNDSKSNNIDNNLEKYGY